jgi:hypothetical protein
MESMTDSTYESQADKTQTLDLPNFSPDTVGLHIAVEWEKGIRCNAAGFFTT